MAMSPKQMGEAVIRNLEGRTGRDVRAWIKIARSSKLKELKTLRAWLKAEHGLGATSCYVIADATLGKPKGEPANETEFVAYQFRDDRKLMKPTYDAIVKAVKACGKDAEIGVRKTQTTFKRGYTFAIAKAPTKTRIDLGIRLPGAKPTKRLAATTAFSDNATHCVRITSPKDVDAQLKSWLKKAYAARG